MENNTLELTKTEEQVQPLTLSAFESMPDLDKATVQNIDLTVEYWTPEKEGESRRCVFSHIENRLVEDEQTGEEKNLDTAFFMGKKDGSIYRFCNASKRLVGIFEGGTLPSGFACQITYVGKKKNSTNNFSSDSWKVNPLKV